MTNDDRAEIAAKMKAALENRRGYADFFGWSTNRNLEELNVLESLAESMKAEGTLFFESLKVRGRTKDPPDCESLDARGQRVAIEVTELVDGSAIKASKAGNVDDWAEWTKDHFLASVGKLITKKDAKYLGLKDPPYNGGYVLVIFSDEPMLMRTNVTEFLKGHTFENPKHLGRIILLLSYDPGLGRCPYFELPTSG